MANHDEPPQAVDPDRLKLIQRMFDAVEPLPERDRNLIVRTLGGDPEAAIKEAFLFRSALNIK